MKVIEIRLNREAVAPLIDFIRPLVESLKDGPSPAGSRLPADTDPELIDAWNEGLGDALRNDTKHFLDLFDRDFLENGAIRVDLENADPVLKIASAVRLLLRKECLENLSDEMLERGEVDHRLMSVEEQKGYGAYLVLGTIQEVVIENMGALGDGS